MGCARVCVCGGGHNIKVVIIIISTDQPRRQAEIKKHTHMRVLFERNKTIALMTSSRSIIHLIILLQYVHTFSARL